jgi:hypothetical protein
MHQEVWAATVRELAGTISVRRGRLHSSWTLTHASGEFAGDRQRRAGVGESAGFEREIVGVVGLAGRQAD